MKCVLRKQEEIAGKQHGKNDEGNGNRPEPGSPIARLGLEGGGGLKGDALFDFDVGWFEGKVIVVKGDARRGPVFEDPVTELFNSGRSKSADQFVAQFEGFAGTGQFGQATGQGVHDVLVAGIGVVEFFEDAEGFGLAALPVEEVGLGESVERFPSVHESTPIGFETP